MALVSKDSSSSSALAYTPIKNLTPSLNTWVIKCQVVNVRDLHYYGGTKSAGCFLKILVVDEQETRIQVIMFNEAAKLFQPVFSVGLCFEIKNGKVKPVNPNYVSAHSDMPYEIVLNANSIVRRLSVALVLPPLGTYEYKKLSEISLFVEKEIDVIAIVLRASDVISTQTKTSGSDLVARREIYIVDDSCTKPVLFTFWRKFANEEGHTISKELTKDLVIIASMKVKGQSFKGGSLATTHNTIIELNPSRPGVQDLRSWAEKNVDLLEEYRSQLAKGTSSQRISISEINDLARNSAIQGPIIKGWITEISTKDPWYIACKSCCRKVYLHEDLFRCTSCLKSSPIATHRYMLRVKVTDPTGDIWMTIFDYNAEKLLQVDVEFLIELKERDKKQYVSILQSPLWKAFSFALNISREEQSQISPMVRCVKVIELAKNDKDAALAPHEVLERLALRKLDNGLEAEEKSCAIDCSRKQSMQSADQCSSSSLPEILTNLDSAPIMDSPMKTTLHRNRDGPDDLSPLQKRKKEQ